MESTFSNRNNYQRDYWKARAESLDHQRKSIADPAQRVGEANFVAQHISRTDSVLEVGCGSGVMTKRIAEGAMRVTAVDIQPLMLESAEEFVGESLSDSIDFIHGDFLELENLPAFDVIVCARVLINLPSVELQEKSIAFFYNQLRPGGRLILLEGFTEAFSEINTLRARGELEPIAPAPVNLYLNRRFWDLLEHTGFSRGDSFSNGLYDVVTRLVLPLAEKEGPNSTELREQLADWCLRGLSGDLSKYSRVQGGVFLRE